MKCRSSYFSPFFCLDRKVAKLEAQRFPATRRLPEKNPKVDFKSRGQCYKKNFVKNLEGVLSLKLKVSNDCPKIDQKLVKSIQLQSNSIKCLQAMSIKLF